MKLTIKDNFPEVKVYIDNVGKQARYAAAVALTLTARDDVKPALREAMTTTFDRPTGYTLNSLFVRGATPQRLEAMVWVKDDSAGSGTPATKYLLPEIEGGKRTQKRFEYALQVSGNMPQGFRAVPGNAARLDAYGNVSRGQIIQILSQLRVQLVAGSNRNISLDAKKRAKAFKKAGGQYVAFPKGRGKLKAGIYQMVDDGGKRVPRAVFIFVSDVTYKRLFKFHEIGGRVAMASFPRRFEVEFSKALRTAK